MGFKSAMQQVDQLKVGHKHRLLQLLQAELHPERPTPMDERIKDVREARFSKALCCPHCQGTTIKRNGKYQDRHNRVTRQRYLCHSCRKTFNDVTLSPFSGTHYPELWPEYCRRMLMGQALSTIAKQLHIAKSTAFYWRHKILTAMRQLGFEELTGIVECDETFFLESQKGQKVVHRKPRKRGGVSKYRGVSREQVCALVAQDRQGHILSQVAGMGQIRAQQLDLTLGRQLKDVTALCTDSAASYKRFAQEQGVTHYTVNNRKGIYKRGIYHIQHVNSYHGPLKGWMRRIRGVATKYLDNYLYWFRFLTMSRGTAEAVAKQRLLVEACITPLRLTIMMMRPKYAAAATLKILAAA